MKRFILLTVLLIAAFIVNGQTDYRDARAANYVNFSNVVPSVAEFQAMKHFHTPKCNGKIDVSIPLYNIKYKNINVPIYLSYNTGGIKLASIASRVGQNWHLTASGMITRVIRGALHDFADYSVSTAEGPAEKKGWHKHYNNSSSIAYDITDDLDDRVPDLYYLNAPGLSTVFVLDKGKSPVELKGDKIERIYCYEGNASGDNDVVKFVIKASNGNKYIFNTYSFGLFGIDRNIQNWYLTRIKYATGEVVNFNYDNGGGTVFRRDYSYAYNAEEYRDCEDQIHIGNSIFANQDFGAQIMYPKRLKSIEFPTGKVIFQYQHKRKDIIPDFRTEYAYTDNEDYALTNMSIQNNNGEIIKTFDFSYDYLMHPYYENTHSRLLLDKLSINDSKGESVKNYDFLYNAGTFPRYNSNRFDFYGYYADNGQSDKKTKIYAYIPKNGDIFNPAVSGTEYYPFNLDISSMDKVVFSGADRTPNLQDMKTGMLKQIVYPTGGIKELQYEMNEFSVHGKTVKGGGLRIKRQIMTDPNGFVSVREYEYGGPEVKLPRFAMLSTDPGLLGSNPSLTQKKQFVRDYTVRYLDNQVNSELYNGSPVLYQNVKEKQPGNGKIIYFFDTRQDAEPNIQIVTSGNYDNYGHLSFNPTSKWPYCNGRSWASLRGSLKEKWYFNEKGKIVKGEGYNYEFHEYGNPLNVKQYLRFDYCVKILNELPIYPGKKVLKDKYTVDVPENSESLDIDFGVSDFSILLPGLEGSTLITEENFYYNNQGQLKKHEKINSDGNTELIEYNYPNEYDYDFFYLNDPDDYKVGEHAKALYELAEVKNNISKPVEKWVMKNNKYTKGVINGYKNFGGFSKLASKYVLELSEPSDSYEESSLYYDLPGNYEKNFLLKIDDRYQKLENITYDPNSGDVIQYQKENDMKISYLWDLNHHNAIAKVSNADTNQIAYTSFEFNQIPKETIEFPLSDDSWLYSGGQLIEDAKTGTRSFQPESIIYTLDSIPSGQYVLSMYCKTSPDAQNHQLGSINLHGINHDPFQVYEGWTYNKREITIENKQKLRIETNGLAIIDELRLYPADAEMTTYTYEPLIGLTSKTDAQAKTTYYKYDDYGRLKMLKDNEGNVLKKYNYNNEDITNIGNEICNISLDYNEGGIVEIDNPTTFFVGDEVQVNINTNEGYYLDKILLDGNSVTPVKPFNFTVEDNHDVEVVFKKKQYDITVDHSSGGIVSPAGNPQVYHGDDLTLQFIPDVILSNTSTVVNGYNEIPEDPAEIENMYEVKNVKIDGEWTGPETSYTFENVTEPHEVYVEFQEKTFTISETHNNGGSVNPSGTNTYQFGMGVEYSFMPDNGYKMEDVVVDGESKGNIATYQFTDLINDHELDVTFALINYNIDVTQNTGGNVALTTSAPYHYGDEAQVNISTNEGYYLDKILLDGNSVTPAKPFTFTVEDNHDVEVVFKKKQYEITVDHNSGGSISPSGNQQVYHGDDLTLQFVPDVILSNTSSGSENNIIPEDPTQIENMYEVKNVKIDGEWIGPETSYTFENVTEPHEVYVEFQEKTFTISETHSSGGSVSPSGTNTYQFGMGVIYHFNPNNGFEVTNVKIDGQSKGAISSYSFTDINTNHSVYAKFEIKTYQIEVQASNTNLGNVTYNKEYGEDLTLTINPDPNYNISNVMVDGVSKGAITSYTFNNIDADHTISVLVIPDDFEIKGG